MPRKPSMTIHTMPREQPHEEPWWSATRSTMVRRKCWGTSPLRAEHAHFAMIAPRDNEPLTSMSTWLSITVHRMPLHSVDSHWRADNGSDCRRRTSGFPGSRVDVVCVFDDHCSNATFPPSPGRC